MKITSCVTGFFALLAFTSFASAGPPVLTTYTANTPSQLVDCNQIDKALSHIPHGDGTTPVTDAETGPGGWRFNSGGRSFVTFAHNLNGAMDGYDVDAGRSNVSGNGGIINDYPAVLDLPQAPLVGVMTIVGKRGDITLTGDTGNVPPLFKLPGAGAGTVRINIQDPDGDGTYEGCAKSAFLKNFGFVKPEGGDFVQREYLKAVAVVDMTGKVTFFEWTEVSTFNNTTSGN